MSQVTCLPFWSDRAFGSWLSAMSPISSKAKHLDLAYTNWLFPPKKIATPTQRKLTAAQADKQKPILKSQVCREQTTWFIWTIGNMAETLEAYVSLRNSQLQGHCLALCGATELSRFDVVLGCTKTGCFTTFCTFIRKQHWYVPFFLCQMQKNTDFWALLKRY